MTTSAPTLGCPNCGAAITADQRHSHMAVCTTCRSVVTFGERAAEVAGTMSVLPPSRSKLYVGATGKLHGEEFVVAGRVRYGYSKGYWDEWYLMMSGGEPAWLSEDERHITLERPAPVDTPWEELGIGSQEIPGFGRFERVEEDTATVEGGEGELPFVVVEGERYEYVDLLGESGETGTYEKGPDGKARLFIGRPLRDGELELVWTRQELGMVDGIPIARKAAGGGRERVDALVGVRALKCGNCGAGMEVDTSSGLPSAVACPYCGTQKRLGGRVEQCPACNQDVKIRAGDDAATSVCGSCGTVCGVSTEGLKVLQLRAAKEAAPSFEPPLRLGQGFTWEGARYQAVGWLTYRTTDGYVYEEELLYGDEGHLWLSFYNNHCTVSARIFDGPSVARPTDAPMNVTFRGHRFRQTEYGSATVTYVVGELPWVAQIGDRVSYVEFASEPYRLSGEWTATEREWSLGRYVERWELEEAVDGDLNLGPTVGVLPHQSYSASKAQSMWIWLVALLLGIGGIIWATTGGEQISQFRVNDAAFRDGGQATPVFKGDKGDVVEVAFEAPRLDQAWSYLTVLLVPADGGSGVDEFSVDLAKFDTGEESEATTSESGRVTLPADGDYRLIVRAKADRVVFTSANKDNALKPAIQGRVLKGKITPLFFIIFSIIAGIVWVYLIADRIGFVARKKLEEDDGSDDWEGWD